MASHTLVQYAKLSNHPRHNAELRQVILRSTSPHQVYEHFLKNSAMQQDMLSEDGKVLNEEYCVPEPHTEFIPLEFEPEVDFQDPRFDENVFTGMAENF